MSTPEEIRAHNEKILAAADLHDRTYKLARAWGASEELAGVFADSQKSKFKWDGVNLLWNDAIAGDSEDCKRHFTTGPLASLFPKAAEHGPDVNPALLEKARGNKVKLAGGPTVGDLSAYSQLVREHGKAAIDALLAETPQANGKDDAPEYKGKSNPWRAEHWSVTEQGRIIRVLGLEVAGRMAAAAQSKIGATKPTRIAS